MKKSELKNFIDKVKEAGAELNEVLTEEIAGSKMVSFIKEKASEVQVQFEERTKGVKEMVEKKIKFFTTEEIDAEESDASLDIVLIVAGLTKDKINVEVDGNILHIVIEDKEIPKEVRSHWSVSKSKIFYDFTRFEETARVDEISVKLVDGILAISIPRKERTKDKKKITIL